MNTIFEIAFIMVFISITHLNFALFIYIVI